MIEIAPHHRSTRAEQIVGRNERSPEVEGEIPQQRHEERTEKEIEKERHTHHAVAFAACFVRRIDRVNDFAREVDAVVARIETETEHFKDPRKLFTVDRSRSILGR